MLLQNACKNHQNYLRKTDENGPNMVPKPLQNRSWRGSGGLLGAIFKTRCFQDLIFDDFGSILGSPLGPVWPHFGHRFFDVFLIWLFDGFGLHLASQNTSKMRPKKEPKLNFIDFARIYNTLATFEGAENDIFSILFWNTVLGWLLDPIFCDFGSLLGSLLETILVTFWVPFLHRFLDPLKTSKNGRAPLPSPGWFGHRLPPPRTPTP